MFAAALYCTLQHCTGLHSTVCCSAELQCSVHCLGRVGKWAIIDTGSDDLANSGTASGALWAIASGNVVNREGQSLGWVLNTVITVTLSLREHSGVQL